MQGIIKFASDTREGFLDLETYTNPKSKSFE